MKDMGEKIINEHNGEGTRESLPYVHDFQHSRLGKSCCGSDGIPLSFPQFGDRFYLSQGLVTSGLNDFK